MANKKRVKRVSEAPSPKATPLSTPPAKIEPVAPGDREFLKQKEGHDGRMRRFYFVAVAGAPRVEIDCDGALWAHAALDPVESGGDTRYEREAAIAYAAAW